MDPAEIERVVRATNPMNILSAHVSEWVGKEILKRRVLIEGKGVVELGSASTALLPYVFQMNIPFYVGVDPFYAHKTGKRIQDFLRDNREHEGKLTAVTEDGLTYLLRQEDQSATVVSSGVLDWVIIGFYICADPAVKQYRQELAREIYRVTPAGGLSYHQGIDSGCRMNGGWRSALVDVGFRVDEINDSLFLKEG